MQLLALCLDHTCGKPKIHPISYKLPIIGGTEATPYSIPWQVSFQEPDQEGHFSHNCGGALLSPRHVITAAHCTATAMKHVCDLDPELCSYVVVGKHSLNDTSDGRIHEICRSREHPLYKTDEGNNPKYDFSIIHLKKPVDIGPRAATVRLPTSRLAGDFLAGKQLTVSGWGRLNGNDFHTPNNLQVVRVPGIRNEVCKRKYTGISSIISAELCAGDLDVGGIDSCKGDSGGNQQNK